MNRFLLTLWFLLTSLAGPGLCCCSFGATQGAIHFTSAICSAKVPEKPVKSCCQRNVPNGKTTNPGQTPKRGTSCPCEHGKQVSSLPSCVPGKSDFSAHLNLLVETLTGLVPSLESVPSLSITAPPDLGPDSRLAGRDLLARYSILRC